MPAHLNDVAKKTAQKCKGSSSIRLISRHRRPEVACCSEAGAVSTASAVAVVQAGPKDEPPDYSGIDRSPFNRAIMALFRRKMVQRIGEDSQMEGYDAIIDLTRKLNSMHPGAAPPVWSNYSNHDI
jgi:hypothetical protein